MKQLVAVTFLALIAACGPISPEAAATRCEERARAAQGPTVGVTLGANSRSGPYASGSFGITSDAIRGRDPLEVYDNCVLRLTGAPPVRPARLR
jgi:hypothetical protein